MPHPSHRPASPQGKDVSFTITALNDFGYGVGQKAGQVISVARTAPGDQVLTRPPRTSDKWTSAELVKIVRPGPDRVESPCRAFTRGCGGCQWLHLSYRAQLDAKEKTLAGILRARARYTGKINPIVPMETPEGCRNKLSLKNVGGRLVFVPEMAGVALAPVECLAQTPALQKAWAALKTWRVPSAVEQLHLRSNAEGRVGIHAFVQSRASGQDAALRDLLKIVPGAIGVGATTRQGYRVVAGDSVLLQRIEGISWLIPHNGFFQTNAVLAGELLDVVRREARATKADRLLDLYCGAGFFGLALASGVSEVVGIEENVQSVEAAEASARASGVQNARFQTGDLGAVLASIDVLPRGQGRDEIAVVDPPREGLLPRALEALVARTPKRIVYVSCYAPSLARDYKALAAAGWRGVSCTPIDMFPHTSHLETVMTMER